MKEDQVINATVINNKKYFLFISIYIISGTLLTTFLAIETKVVIVIWIGIFIFWLCPFLFQNQFRKGFSQNALIRFSQEKIVIELFNIKTGDLNNRMEEQYSEIKSFKAINSSKDDTAFIKIVLKDGDSVGYTFLNQGKNANDTDITAALFFHVNQFNTNQNEEEKIVLMPNFFATRTGKFYIVGLSILLMIAILLQTMYNAKTIPFTLFTGFIFFLIIIAQRKKDIDQLKRMK